MILHYIDKYVKVLFLTYEFELNDYDRVVSCPNFVPPTFLLGFLHNLSTIFCCATLSGSKALLQHRQVVAEDHAEGARDNELRPVLCRRRHACAAASAFARAARNVSKIVDGLPGEEAASLSKVRVVPPRVVLSIVCC